MAINIDMHLKAILGEIDGETVLQNAINAIDILNKDYYKDASVQDILNEIKTTPYGKKIRYGIYEILDRFNNRTPTAISNNSCIMGPMMTTLYGVVSKNVICGIMERTE